MSEENTPVENLQESQQLLIQAGSTLKVLAAADPETTLAGLEVDRAVVSEVARGIYNTIWDAIGLLDGVKTHLEKEARS